MLVAVVACELEVEVTGGGERVKQLVKLVECRRVMAAESAIASMNCSRPDRPRSIPTHRLS